MTPKIDSGMTFSPPAFSEEPAENSVLLRRDEPAWDVARLFPLQGHWTEAAYLALDANHRIVELRDGFLEVHPVPSFLHQFISQFLLQVLNEFLRGRNLGAAVMAPCPVRLAESRLREPDVFVVRPQHLTSLQEPSSGADMVVEVVSPGAKSRHRDLIEKRAEYAEAQIPEYWIVDPEKRTITVLALGETAEYEVHGEFAAGQRATSQLFPDFSVEVDAVFAAGSEFLQP